MSYKQYRSYGHGPLTAFTLSIHPLLWYGSAVLVGVIGALML